MSTSIDSKVVELKFDNTDFVQKVQGTLDSVNELQKGLKFDGVSDKISSIADATNETAKAFSEDSDLAKGIASIAEHFTLFGKIQDQIGNKFVVV